MLRVVDVTPLETYRLRLEFNDGTVRDVDCAFLLHGTLGEPLRDREYFRQVRVDHERRTMVWPNGLDPAPELLHGDYETASDMNAGLLAPSKQAPRRFWRDEHWSFLLSEHATHGDASDGDRRRER